MFNVLQQQQKKNCKYHSLLFLFGFLLKPLSDFWRNKRNSIFFPEQKILSKICKWCVWVGHCCYSINRKKMFPFTSIVWVCECWLLYSQLSYYIIKRGKSNFPSTEKYKTHFFLWNFSVNSLWNLVQKVYEKRKRRRKFIDIWICHKTNRITKRKYFVIFWLEFALRDLTHVYNSFYIHIFCSVKYYYFFFIWENFVQFSTE